MQAQKRQNDLCSFPRQTRPIRPFRTNTPKRCPFHYGDWNANTGSQETPGVTGKFGLETQNEAKQRLTEF